MIMRTIFLLAFIPVHCVSAAGPLPKDVQTFVRNAVACEHMAGEWDSELPRSQRREITRSIKKYCAPAKQQLPVLTEKYKENSHILRTISQHAYESVKSYTEVDASH